MRMNKADVIVPFFLAQTIESLLASVDNDLFRPKDRTMETGMFQRGSALVTTSLRTRPIKSRTKFFPCSQFSLQFQCRALSTSASLTDASAVRILEVGPRDGLQNIKQSIATPIKVELIRRLASAGLRNIEATSFVSPKWVPQLADGATVMNQILPLAQQSQIRFPVLVPNAKQRSQQLVREVRRAFFSTITVTDSESLLPEIPELLNLGGPSAE
jgi:hypothetical protein